ncbi:MAG: YncE family protein, partial [Terriglobia bacterium]
MAVNLASFKRLRAIPLGFAPGKLFVRPHSRELVAAGKDGTLAVISLPQMKVTRTVGASPGSTEVIFSPDGSRAYVQGGGKILVYDCARWTLLRAVSFDAPLARIALALDGRILLAEDAARSRLDFVATADGGFLGSVVLGKDPGPMVVVRSKVFIANPVEDTVTAIDIPAREVLSQIETAGAPTALALKPDGGELFALSAPASTMTIIDTLHDSVEQSVPAGTAPAAAVFTSDSGTLYVANSGDGTVAALDVATRKITASIRVGVQPDTLALTPDERFLVAADRAAGSLAIMRARPLTL